MDWLSGISQRLHDPVSTDAVSYICMFEHFD
jgi:hypothetical protein